MLSDRFGRTIDYLRVSVTDRCDLRCSYCLPKGFKDFEEPENWLTFDEIERVISVFTKLGTRRIRLTGGEPLLRRDLSQLVGRIAAVPGVTDLSLTTNGTQLDKHAKDLFEAGLHRLNVSLDSLQRDSVSLISGRDCLDKVLQGLFAARNAGFQTIKINMVPILGVNEDDIEEMIAFCIKHGFMLRLIEAMPVGHTGQQTQGLDLLQRLSLLITKYDLQESCKILGGGPARYWESQDGNFILGLITPMSQHFCSTCNRVRLSVDGTLYMCLGQNESVGLRTLLRAGCSDIELEAVIREAIELKPKKHEFIERPQQIMRFMSLTGG